MKFVSFNINGLRAHAHQIKVIIDKLQPDVLGLQETKIHDNIFPVNEILQLGYHVCFYGQKSNYGVALLSKKKPLNIRRGFCDENEQAQRRIIMADFITSKGLLTVINGYFPQGENRKHPIKFPAKKIFYQNLYKYINKNYSIKELLLIMGDMNISPTDLDIGIGEKNRNIWINSGKCSFLPEERIWMQQLLNWGLVDTYLQDSFTKKNKYSWFDYRTYNYNKNYGLRIDLLLASYPLAKMLKSTGIDYDIRAMNKPSDHAPAWADFLL